MDHGVDASGVGDVARHGKRQRRVEHGNVGVKLARHDAHFLIVVGGDDGNVGDFRACAGGGGQERERNACAFHHVDAVDVFEALFRVDEAGDDLGRVH